MESQHNDGDGAATKLPDEEIAYYNERFDELKAEYPGRFLLIHKRALIGDYGSFDEAVNEGVRRYGAGPFLVRQAGQKTLTTSAPVLTHGLPTVAYA